MVPADSIESFSTNALDGQPYPASSIVRQRKKPLHPRVVAVVCGNSWLTLTVLVWAYTRGIAHLCLPIERAEAGLRVGIELQLNQEPDYFLLVFFKGRFAGKVLVYLNG